MIPKVVLKISIEWIFNRFSKYCVKQCECCLVRVFASLKMCWVLIKSYLKIKMNN